MPSAARVGDQVMHSQALPEAKHGFWGGLLKGAIIGAAIVAVAAVAVVATVGTGGLGAPFAIGGAMVVIGSALRYGSVGFSEGAQKGAQKIVPAGPITTGSPSVFINGKAAALACLSLVACTQHGPKSKVAQGSQTVTINSKMASRVGDLGTCSFVIGEGSENVFIGAPAGTCAAISGEIPDWMWTGVKVAYWTGTVMEVVGGLMMGGTAGLKALLTPAGLSVLGGSMLAGHLASEWAKSQGYSLSDQMMFGDLTGAFVGAGLATGGPSAMRGLQQMADAMPRFDLGMEPAFAGGPRMGGFEPELVPRDPNGPGMDAWNPPKNEPLQMTGDENGTGSNSPDFTGKLRGEDVTLPGVKTQAMDYTKRSPEDLSTLRREFDSTKRSDFLEGLANDPQKVQQLKDAGLSDADIAKMQDGYVPGNQGDWQVHHKYPLDDGGTNDPDNLVLIRNEPYHKTITNEQNSLTRGMKSGETKHFENWPVPDGYIYPPVAPAAPPSP